MFVTDTTRKECELLPRFQKRPDFRERAMNAIKKVGLKEYIDCPIDNLSGGQSRLLSLAATVFMTESPLTILDEPEFGIDLRTWDRLFQTFLRLKENGKSVVMLTHWLDTTLFCDYVIVMNKGKIVRAGHPLKVYQDEKLMEQLGIDVPSIYPLFLFLWQKGYQPKDVASLIEATLREVY
jgi:energy-coupling factor transporter ATP-binding protein EcfA2